MSNGTDLYHRVIAYDHDGDDKRKQLTADVWRDTPWVIDAFTGSIGDRREREIMGWCREEFGNEHCPIHGRSGTWQRGGATVYGWTWMGFATEEMMQKFIERWPTPDEEQGKGA